MFLIMLATALANQTDITAASPVAMSVNDLGMLLDEHFQPVHGADRIIHRPGSAPRTTPGETVSQWVTEVTTSTLEAEARGGWAIFSTEASGSTSTEESYAIYRAYQTSQVHTVAPQSIRNDQVPEGAIWYVSAVHVGRMYTRACRGTQQALSAEISGGVTTPIYSVSGKGGGTSTSERANCSQRMLGFEAMEGREGASLYAENSADVANNYQASGDERVVLVQYSRVPAGLVPVPKVDSSRGYTVTLNSAQMPGTKRSGESWDMFGGAPDISVWAKLDGVVVFRSQIEEDRQTATFNSIIQANLGRSGPQTLEFTVMDHDMGDSDFAGRASLVVDGTQTGEIQLRTEDGVVISVTIGGS
jgi:hypothetical protein